MFEVPLLDALSTPHLSWWLLPLALLSGVLTSFTPCVYPLLPITLATMTKYRAQLAPLQYCLGFAAIYALLGGIAAWSGSLFGVVASNPWIQVAFANLLIYLALVNKGWLAFPRLPGLSFQATLSPLWMGMASALVAAPCTSPVLGGLLLFVASSQHLVFGALLLFSFAVGMSTLLLVAGLSSQLLNRLPRAGSWLNHISTVSALLLLIMAQYFLIQAGKSWL
ncbi:cytochrome c biogenesis protein CcdA [Pseudoalteromonas sp. OOF1S-7]|uniref:cytochrome c biogenesis protein CcdA n=1 Tax=Pseudoalteromonas sp. OOF1S-7 TaxID=2917757 RepID=UPI001EF6E19E|nr:cytochrome c biogenesis protein CcdA [Pseudoalteromonas sp. OOF1S-7]MCG7536169.1 sulfite exporter TauE/SafE family protein [Pseudoalteromonas sp. OOF1S-7]